MTNIEHNAILYYADILSLKETSKPITDNCKYYFIHNAPINSAYIVDLEPIYDKESIYYKQAVEEFNNLKDKFADNAVSDIIGHMCCLDVMGCINAEQMLKCIHLYSSRKERAQAFSRYYNWRNNQTYTHTTLNDDGDPIETNCTRYVSHFEAGSKR